MPGFADFAGVVEITRLNTSEFLYYQGELYGHELVFAFSFVSSDNTERNYRVVYPTAHKVCL